MVRPWVWNAVLGLALVGLLLPLGAAQGGADPAGVERFKVKLIGVETSYGQEKWKTHSAFQSPTAQAAESDAARYDRALGYRVILRVQLVDEQGNNVPNDLENRNVNLSATLRTGRGDVQGYVQRLAGTVPLMSDATVFKIHFDVDGSNFALPAARSAPALFPGPGHVHVEIFKRGATGTVLEAGEDDLIFDYRRPQSRVTVDGFGERDYLSEVPDSTFRLLDDIGEGTTVPFITDQVPDAATLRAEYGFGLPDRTVRWLAMTPVPCSSPACLPTNGSATTEILTRVIGSAKTNALGNASFSVPVKDLLTYPGRTAPLAAAIVVVAAALQPEADLPAELGAQYAKGGFDIATGSDEFVLAIGSRPARVTGYSIDTRAQENVTGRAPNPIDDYLAMANFLVVSLYDDAGSVGCANCGDAIAIVPDGDGRRLGNATISSVADPDYAAKYRTARIPVSGIHMAQVSWYRILNLFYQSPGDVFQGMVYADRGYEIQTYAPTTRVSEQGTYYVNVTSRSTNYDVRAGEPNFEMKVIVRVATENGLNETATVVVGEGATVSREIKISSSRVGSLAITYEATSGDTAFGPKVDSATFHDRAPKKRLADRIPGFEAVVVGVALLGALALLRRREAF